MPKWTERVEVEATAQFMHDGANVRPGERLTLSAADARDLIAAGFAQVTRVTYVDRALRARAR